MPDPTTRSRLTGLILSAVEIRNLTGWPEPMVEDYLNILENLVTISDILDAELDQKIEEVPTDFIDGSIPFVDGGFLKENNPNLFWSNVLLRLLVKSIQTDFVDFNLLADPGMEEGRIAWDEDDHTLKIGTGLGNTIQVGQELWGIGVNKTGITAVDGKVVYANGVQGNRLTYDFADARDGDKSSFVGVVTSPTDNNQEGPVTTFGYVRNLDTSAWVPGTKLYIAANDTGDLTSTPPTGPDFIILVANVTIQHANQGEIFVAPRIDIGNGVTISSIFVNTTITAQGIITGDEVVGEFYEEGDSIVTADSITLNTGTLDSGTVVDTRTINEVYYQVGEVSGTPGFDAEFNFILASNPGKLVFKGRYEGNPAHNVVVEAWNYTASTWDSFTGAASDLPSSATDYQTDFDYADLAGAITDYINGTASKFRIQHTSAGVATHDLFVDYVAIQVQQIVITTAGTYQTVTGYTLGLNNNVTMSAANGTMTIVEDGKYLVNMNVSFGGTDNAAFEAHLFSDDVKIDKIGLKRKLGSSGDIGSAGFTGVVDLSATEVLKIKITSDIAGVYASIENINWNITRLN